MLKAAALHRRGDRRADIRSIDSARAVIVRLPLPAGTMLTTSSDEPFTMRTDLVVPFPRRLTACVGGTSI